MADSKGLFLVGRTTDPPKPRSQRQAPVDAKEIAGEVLTVVRNVAQALHQYHLDTEIALGEIAGLLDYLEIVALRGVAKGGTR